MGGDNYKNSIVSQNEELKRPISEDSDRGI